MKCKGKFHGISRDIDGHLVISFLVYDEKSLMEQLDSIKDIATLAIEAVKPKVKRSLNANALLWKCLGDIANAIHADKWTVYLEMLKRYGKYTYICVKPSVVDAVKAQWRECEEIGEIDVNGQKAVQLLCYFGSSTYDTKEFSHLLDGVVSEMEEIGLEKPMSSEMRRALEQWKNNGNVLKATQNEKHHSK